MRLLALLALVGCTAEESGIADLHLRGTVVVPPLGVPSSAKPRNVKVGAYLAVDGAAPDPLDRGHAVGGAAVSEWTLGDDGTWYGDYEMIVLQSVGPVLDPDNPDVLLDLDVNPDLDEVWLVAMDTPDLAGAFTSDTRYSSEPVRVDLTGPTWEGVYEDAPLAPAYPIVEADPVTLDAQVPRVVGWFFTESESNDVSLTGPENQPRIDQGGFTACNDLVSLSGIGVTDTIEGGMAISAGDSYRDHDIDCFHFQVPDPGHLLFTVWYDNEVADAIAVVAWRADGTYFDITRAEAGETPAHNGFPLNEDLVPGDDYYLVVIVAGGLVGEEAQYLIDVEEFSE